MLPSGKTGQRLGKIPLVLGMPVVVNQNFDIDGGLVNGSFGYLWDYWFENKGDGIRTLTSCIVEIPDLTCDQLPHLPPKHVPIISDTVGMSIIHPVSRQSFTVKQFQVPLAPGFAMTAHKAQGLTLPHVIVDLANCIGTESPYVMVSRCTSLGGLMVMRPFPFSKVRCRRSQEARNKFARLDLLRWQTIATFGTPEEQLTAGAHFTTQDSDRSVAVDQLFQGTCLEDPKQIGALVEQLQNDDESAYGFDIASDRLTSGLPHVTSPGPQTSTSP